MADVFQNESVAALYSQVRPSMPAAVVRDIEHFYQNGDETARINHAVDVGCGSGQFTVLLAAVAGSVTAVDFSKAQIDEAKRIAQAKNIVYSVASYSDLPVQDGSTDVITSSQAAHFFDHAKFHAEVDRCLRPGGCLALTGYGLAMLQDVPEEAVSMNSYLLDKQLRPYWFAERHLVDNCYRDMPLPYSNNKRVDTFLERDMSIEAYSLYLKSTSSYFKYKESVKTSEDIVDDFINKLQAIIGGSTISRLKIRWPVFLVLSRK